MTENGVLEQILERLGRAAAAKAIFGADRRASGEVVVNGQPIAGSPQAAVDSGVALVPEDRMRQGLLDDPHPIGFLADVMAHEVTTVSEFGGDGFYARKAR